MSCSLNSLNGAICGITIGAIQGDARSLDYSSYTYPYAEFVSILLSSAAWPTNKRQGAGP